MKRKSPAQVKNAMRRAFDDLLDPPPTLAEQNRLRTHFEHRCAYCGAAAGPRDGHIDHALASGGNGIRNLVLACRICNGDEKREMHWEAFLALKCHDDPVALAERRERIVGWLGTDTPTDAGLPPDLIALRQLAEAEAKAAFDAAYRRVSVAAASWRGRRP